MKSIKENLPWIAPTAAILFSAGLLATTGVLGGGKDTAATFSEAAPAPSVIVQPQSIVTAAAPVRDATLGNVDGLQIINSLKRATTSGISDFEVSRSEPISLLDTTTVITPKAEPKRVIKEVDSSKAADFFAAAQANLAADDSCVDDLRALTNNTRVYFPAGGLTAEESGFLKARGIGQLAKG